MHKPTRHEVFAVINGERAYQIEQTKNPDRPDMVEDLSMGDYISAMEHCLMEARTKWYSGSTPHIESLNFIRKVAGLTVACMEQHGAPPREV